jgi:hypothetical protein
MFIPKDPFDVRIGDGALTGLARRIAKKHGVSVAEMRRPTRQGRRPKHITDAIGEFCYEAYKSGLYSLTAIAVFCNVKGKRCNRTIDDRIREYCRRHGLERPRWGMYSKPLWRIFDDGSQRASLE